MERLIDKVEKRERERERREAEGRGVRKK